MRAIKTAFQHLSEHMNDKVLNDNNESYFKFIDWWNEQTEFDEYEFDTPACFIDIFVPKTEAMGQMGTNPTLQIDIYVAFDTFAESYRGSSNQETALEFLEILARVNEQTNGYTAPEVGNLSIINAGPFRTASQRNVYRLSYGTDVIDQSATIVRKPRETVTPGVEPIINKRPFIVPTVPEGNGDKFFNFDLSS